MANHKANKFNLLVNDIIDAFLPFIVKKPEQGLNYFMFKLASYMLPLVNIELLVYNKEEKVAMSWREKSKDVPIAGWHLPGGIFRIGETLEERVKKTAEKELGVNIDSWRIIAITETILPIRISRRHFISFLIECDFIENDSSLNSEIRFFKEAPDNIIINHKRYVSIISKGRKGNQEVRFIGNDSRLTNIYKK